MVSLYWAVSTTANVGYGDIFALTDLEVGIACMCIHAYTYCIYVCIYKISYSTLSTYNSTLLAFLLHITHTHTHTRTHARMHTHTRTHTHARTHTHTHMQHLHDTEDICLASNDVWHCGLWLHHCQCGCEPGKCRLHPGTLPGETDGHQVLHERPRSGLIFEKPSGQVSVQMDK